MNSRYSIVVCSFSDNTIENDLFLKGLMYYNICESQKKGTMICKIIISAFTH